MPRPLTEIITHLRSVSANPAIDTTLIQTEDLLALCDAAKPTDVVLICAKPTNAERTALEALRFALDEMRANEDCWHPATVNHTIKLVDGILA